MADSPSDQEKTEAPTERRLEKAFEEGSIQQPQDFYFLAATITALAAFPLWLLIMGAIGEMQRRGFAAMLGLGAGFGIDISADLREAMRLPLLAGGVFFLAALVVGLAQQRFRLTARPLRATLTNLLPSKGLARLFGAQGLTQSGAAAVKVALTAAVLGALLLPLLAPGFLRADIWTAHTAAALAWRAAVPVVLAVILLLTLFAIADLMLKRTMTRRQLRMTRQEMKEEMKETEGNPEVKSRLRQLRRQRRGTSRKHPLKTADVVLTNPTHYAVAMAWYPGSGRAPMVIGKGAGLFARRLRLLAWTAGIPIIREPALARSIFRTTDIDSEVPEALYADVARILIYVYRLRGKPLPG
jgi:flagellar biosynthetic protein FlhB